MSSFIIGLCHLLLIVSVSECANECFDRSVKCPEMRNDSCKKPAGSYLKTLCPASCNKCTIKSNKPSDSEVEERMKQCCNYNNMTKDCTKQVCHYNMTNTEIYQAYSDNKCYWSDAAIWVMCASDGNDNTDCCQSNKVESKCLGFCQGKFDKKLAQVCILKHLKTIVNCNRKAMKSYV